MKNSLRRYLAGGTSGRNAYLVAGGKIIDLIAVIVVASYLSDATNGIIRRGAPNDTLGAVRDKLTHLRAKLSRSRRKNNKERTK